MSNADQILTLNVSSLLDGQFNYSIPEYQRNYAWQEGEITALIQDIIDYVLLSKKAEGPFHDQDTTYKVFKEQQAAQPRDYYLGTLVVYPRERQGKTVYETIDGQQRLTTLTLLASTLRHHAQETVPWFQRVNLQFANRKAASETLREIFTGGHGGADDTWNQSLVHGYHLCRKLLPEKLKESNLDMETFAAYFSHSVKILQVNVPVGTDLNHYFEIMNNRGEQLEKHEILKSRLMGKLQETLPEPDSSRAQAVLTTVWEACANLDQYVQMGFRKVAQRDAVFGANHWNRLAPSNFGELANLLSNLPAPPVARNGQWELGATGDSLPLSKLVEMDHVPPPPRDGGKGEGVPERFNSVINFPNFLLHVLRIQMHQDIQLDDKRLIPIFESVLKQQADQAAFIQNFIYLLLKCRFLFDKYVIKREFLGGKDRWSLLQLKWNAGNKISYTNTFGKSEDDPDSENKTILMLLSMFHVSTPTHVYKHWLNAALLYVSSRDQGVDAAPYKNYLLAVARSFVFDRFLCTGQPKEYFDIIYRSDQSIIRDPTQVDRNKLRYGSIQNNLVFNYLDFLLWEKHRIRVPSVNKYEFTSRSSVEHYYPQHPMKNYPEIEEASLNSFGNLCLISHSKNSRLSNLPPFAKRTHYKGQELDSVKQWVMMSRPDPWDENAIADHESDMMATLTLDMDSCFDTTISSRRPGEPETRNQAAAWFQTYRANPVGRQLLCRALMCFDDIDSCAGSTYYLGSWHDKYSLYDWDSIGKSSAYQKFAEYMAEKNPVDLEEIIQERLERDPELAANEYRKLFVLHPEIWRFCQQGLFSWVNDGNIILLHQRERNTVALTRDVFILLLGSWLEAEYEADVNYQRELLEATIAYNRRDDRFTFTECEEGEGTLVIERNGAMELTCLVRPYRNDTRTYFIRNLIEHGWQQLQDGTYQMGNSSTLSNLDGRHEKNFQWAQSRLLNILRGLEITPTGEP